MQDDSDLFVGATIRGFVKGQNVFGRYELLRLLGRGGMGVVWLAKDHKLDREVALKFVPELFANDATAIAELKRETRRSLELTHPNIVRVYDFVQDEQLAAISMEYIDGKTLAELRTNRPAGAFDPPDLHEWLAQLCAALDYAHRDAQVVHRDLKPANIMIDHRGRVKITDFGISATVSDTVTRVTRVSSTSGTLTYMSPQQMFGQQPTFADDIYSLGAVLYDLLTGKPPFFRGNIALQVERQEPATITSRRVEFEISGDPIPEPWEKAVAACLAKDPSQRPQSASEVVARINSGNDSAPPAPPPGPASPPLVTPPPTTPIAITPAPPTPTPPPTIPPAVPAGVSSDSPDTGHPSPPARKGKIHILWIATILLLGGVAAAYFLGWYPDSWNRFLPRPPTTQQETAKAETTTQAEPADTTEAALEDETPPAVRFQIPDTTQTTAEGSAGATTTEAAEELQSVVEETAMPESTQPPADEGKAAEPEAKAQPPPPPSPPPEFVVQIVPAVAGARVWLGPRTDLGVDDSGRLSLRDLPLGDHRLTVRAPGYETYTATVEMTDEGGMHQVTLIPLRVSLAVTARPGTHVSAIDERGQRTDLGSTDANGTLVLDDALDVGRYTLRFEHRDCEPVELAEVNLSAARRNAFAPVQKLLSGNLRVLTDPAEAEVSLNGQHIGMTPLLITDLAAETPVTVHVSKSGYKSVTRQVTVHPRETQLLDLGRLDAESGAIGFEFATPGVNLSRARISVDGNEMPATYDGSRWRLDSIPPGTHTVEIHHPDFAPWRGQVTTAGGTTTPLPVAFAEKAATVLLRVTGAADFRVTVDGKQVDATRGSVRVPAEVNVTLEVMANRFRPVSRTVNLAAGATEPWEVALQPLDRAIEGEPFVARSIGLQMVWIPPGQFVMGSERAESGPDSDERPLTRVQLTSGYWMGATEITQAQWTSVMKQNPSRYNESDRAPVDSITWAEATAFCHQLTALERAAGRLPEGYSFTLPTEAQWEYACRAGTTSAYNGPPAAVAWMGVPTTQEVGQKQPNAWGLYDMHGNVAEWTASWYGRYPGGNQQDYAGPSRGRLRVIRGGSISAVLRTGRSAHRDWLSPTARNEKVGFRVVLVKR